MVGTASRRIMCLHRPMGADEGLKTNRTTNNVSTELGRGETLVNKTQEVPEPEGLTFSLWKKDCMQISKAVNHLKIALITPNK